MIFFLVWNLNRSQILGTATPCKSKKKKHNILYYDEHKIIDLVGQWLSSYFIV